MLKKDFVESAAQGSFPRRIVTLTDQIPLSVFLHRSIVFCNIAIACIVLIFLSDHITLFTPRATIVVYIRRAFAFLRELTLITFKVAKSATAVSVPIIGPLLIIACLFAYAAIVGFAVYKTDFLKSFTNIASMSELLSTYAVVYFCFSVPGEYYR